jgi:hypothetical protein
VIGITALVNNTSCCIEKIYKDKFNTTKQNNPVNPVNPEKRSVASKATLMVAVTAGIVNPVKKNPSKT